MQYHQRVSLPRYPRHRQAGSLRVKLKDKVGIATAAASEQPHPFWCEPEAAEGFNQYGDPLLRYESPQKCHHKFRTGYTKSGARL
jgi:hypothetical protein